MLPAKRSPSSSPRTPSPKRLKTASPPSTGRLMEYMLQELENEWTPLVRSFSRLSSRETSPTAAAKNAAEGSPEPLFTRTALLNRLVEETSGNGEVTAAGSSSSRTTPPANAESVQATTATEATTMSTSTRTTCATAASAPPPTTTAATTMTTATATPRIELDLFYSSPDSSTDSETEYESEDEEGLSLQG